MHRTSVNYDDNKKKNCLKNLPHSNPPIAQPLELGPMKKVNQFPKDMQPIFLNSETTHS